MNFFLFLSFSKIYTLPVEELSVLFRYLWCYSPDFLNSTLSWSIFKESQVFLIFFSKFGIHSHASKNNNKRIFTDQPFPFWYGRVSRNTTFLKVGLITKKYKKQEAHGPWLAHLSEIATVDMQMLCDIFSNTVTKVSLQLMKGSSFWTVLRFEAEECVFYYFFTIYGHDSQWSMTIWTSSQSPFQQ